MPPIQSVAIISSFAQSISNFRGPLVRRLVAAGIEVYALAPDFSCRTRGQIRSLGAIPIDIPMNRTGTRIAEDIVNFARLTACLWRIRPDATFAYFVKPVVYGTVAAWLTRVPRRIVLVAGLGYLFIDSGHPRSFFNRAVRRAALAMYRAAFSLSDTVFFQNKDDLEFFAERNVIDESKAVILGGSGVNLERFRFTPSPAHPIRFLLIARLLREKGIVEFVDAALELKSRKPDLEFQLVGGADSNPGSFSSAQIRAWEETGAIKWAGEVDDVTDWIRQASVFVLPSYREGVPRSTQEAMAMGRAVVSTDVPGCRETVDVGVNGFLVPAKDPKALAEAMWKFVQEPALISKMGRASRQIAEQRFDVRKINDRIFSALELENAS